MESEYKQYTAREQNPLYNSENPFSCTIRPKSRHILELVPPIKRFFFLPSPLILIVSLEVETPAALFVRSKSRGYKAQRAKNPPAEALNASDMADDVSPEEKKERLDICSQD